MCAAKKHKMRAQQAMTGSQEEKKGQQTWTTTDTEEAQVGQDIPKEVVMTYEGRA